MNIISNGKFTHTNDVDNTVKVITEKTFIAVQTLTSTSYTSMTIKKEYVKDLYDFLGEYLKE